MRRLTMLSLVVMFAASACSSGQESSTTAPTVDANGAAIEPESSVSADGENPSVDADAPEAAPDDGAVTEDDLSLFIAAAERALEGTAQEAAIFDDPEIYIALAQSSCDRFSAGDSFEQIATDLLAEIDTDGATDETRLVGAILGAATQTLCPEHADKI